MLRNKINYYGNRSENSVSIHENIINTPEETIEIPQQKEEYILPPPPVIENIPEPIVQQPEPVIQYPVQQQHRHVYYDTPIVEKQDNTGKIILLTLAILMLGIAVSLSMK